ncbi:MAG: hypothetical protein HC834_08695 [Rhodospirillales bacterium]|nr:hypothetical protein [Rhodospirillales bacterium]
MLELKKGHEAMKSRRGILIATLVVSFVFLAALNALSNVGVRGVALVSFEGVDAGFDCADDCAGDDTRRRRADCVRRSLPRARLVE